MASAVAPAAEFPIAVKITYQGVTKKFKIPLADLTPAVLPSKVSSACCPPLAAAASGMSCRPTASLIHHSDFGALGRQLLTFLTAP